MVVSETIGNMGFDEGIVEWINDAHDRFLQPGGQVIPRRVETLVAAVEIPADYDFVDGWSGDHHGFDFSAIRRAARRSLFWTDLSPRQLVTDPAVCFSADLTSVVTTPLSGRVRAHRPPGRRDPRHRRVVPRRHGHRHHPEQRAAVARAQLESGRPPDRAAPPACEAGTAWPSSSRAPPPATPPGGHPAPPGPHAPTGSVGALIP